MIDVEIRGPLPQKKYDQIKKLLRTAGEKLSEGKNNIQAHFGGACFTLTDPGDGQLYYYSCKIVVNYPDEVKDAQQKLQILVKKYKLPVWGESEMTAFIKNLSDKLNK